MIRDMSPKEIYIAIKSINKRKKNEFHFQAGIHGVKLDEAATAETINSKPAHFTEEEDEKLSKYMEMRIGQKFKKV